MNLLIFTIQGNQEEKTGNPIPYFRQTQGTKWSAGAKRYHDWAGHVRATLIDEIQRMKPAERAKWKPYIDFTQKKPIKAVEHKQTMNICCRFKNKAHADSDNVFKGIADALFMNDKYLKGSFDYTYAEKGKGGEVFVILELMPRKE